MIHSITRTPLTAVVHIRHTEQLSLCEQFVRVQEFYESPYPEIRGHYFKLSTFLERYRHDHGGKLLGYFTDWHGFNIPGHVVEKFLQTFHHDLTQAEKQIETSVWGLEKFYLIGSHEGDQKEDALDHELVHATYYLDDLYRAEANVLVCDFQATLPGRQLTAYLKNKGYGDSTLDDELNAYLSTTDEQWWVEELHDEVLAKRLWDEGEDFRALASKYRTSTRWLPREQHWSDPA